MIHQYKLARRQLFAALVLLAASGVLSPVSGQSPATTTGAGSNSASSYVIRAGDVLSIRVWPDSSLGGNFPIEDTGLIYLPVLGAIPVADNTLDLVRTDLRERYARALKQPIVTITPKFPVSVLGAVQRPGLYEANPSMNLFDVLSVAGGFRQDAAQDRITIVRNGEVIEVDASMTFQEGGAAMSLSLQSGDRIIVPQRRFRIGARDILFVLQSAGLIVSLVRTLN